MTSAPQTQRPSSNALLSDPDELRKGFRSLETRQHLAELIDVRDTDLVYFAYRLRTRYRTFRVRKRGRRSGYRVLREPVSGLKIIQYKLHQVLSAVYRPPQCVHGFVTGRSIATNAAVHEGARIILNVDLLDFFGTVKFWRVRGLLMAKPYELPRDVATIVAQLCTEEHVLPQGAPTSPILANMVARSLDSDLSRLVLRYRATYTRYADDLTFSSARRLPEDWFGESIPKGLGCVVSGQLRAMIEENGFTINEKKVHLTGRPGRLEVTSLVVNDRTNVRRKFVREIRSMLHAWERYGEDEAEYHWSDGKDRHPSKGLPAFRNVVFGKIQFVGMVRGFDDPLFDKLYRRYCELACVTVTPMEARSRNHITRRDDAIWVLESEDSQGTGFFLGEHGIVTCAHVLQGTVEAFSPKRPDARYATTVLASSSDLDLALLKVDCPAPFRLADASGHHLEAGTQVEVWGYPDYNPGSSLWMGPNTVTGHRKFDNVTRYTLGAPLAKGMSGGPVFDRRRFVVGCGRNRSEPLQ